MFHRPSSEMKQQSDSSRTPSQQTANFLAHAPFGHAPLRGEQQLARLHSAYGNQATLRLLSQRAPAIQMKLAVSKPGDEFELEADRVADQVMRMSAPDPAVQRKCSSCEEEGEKARLQRKESTAEPQFAPPPVHAVLSSPGRPLDPAIRAFMEPRFGVDFSGVRVHDDAQSAQSAKSVNALAYTVGNNVVFDANQYQPGSNAGRRLVAHELAHVVQQGQSSGLQPVVQRQPKSQSPACPPAAQPVRPLPADFSSSDNVQTLAEILWNETSGIHPAEEKAIGSIVINRLLTTTFHKVRQLKSFSAKPNPPQHLLTLACELLTGQHADPTNGAWFYFSPQSMPDEANSGCCAGQSGPCSNAAMKGTDCSGGLQAVPGTDPPRKVFFPKFATPAKQLPQPQGTDPMLIQAYKQ